MTSVFYVRRRQEYATLDGQDERVWEAGFREWCLELEDDLDTRCLWLPRDIGDGMVWSDVMRWREATLYAEANENWQRERVNLLRQGYDYETARIHLSDDYYSWLDTPQSRLDEQSPREVIAVEHLEHDEEADENASDDLIN